MKPMLWLMLLSAPTLAMAGNASQGHGQGTNATQIPALTRAAEPGYRALPAPLLRNAYLNSSTLAYWQKSLAGYWQQLGYSSQQAAVWASLLNADGVTGISGTRGVFVDSSADQMVSVIRGALDRQEFTRANQLLLAAMLELDARRR